MLFSYSRRIVAALRQRSPLGICSVEGPRPDFANFTWLKRGNEILEDEAVTMTSNQQILLQILKPGDWLLWRKLRMQALTEASYAFSSKLADWQGAADSEERWRGRLSSVPYNVVASMDGNPVGMVSATGVDQHGTVELISMWVAPSGRGYGVGDTLIAAVLQWAKEQQAGRVSLSVRTANQHAIALYSRNGFVDSGESTSVNPGDVLERYFVHAF